MKVRQGYVSNSSTTSFCIMGVSLNGRQTQWEEREKIEAIKGLETYVEPCSGYGYAGMKIENMGEHETLGEFRARAATALVEAGLLKEGQSPSLINDAWSDG